MPQQRRAQLTRRAILAAAAEEFDSTGYAGTTLNAVLRRSGITKGAFYFHFPSKEAVAEALAAAGVPPTARPEQLTLQNYADVSDALFAFR